MVQSRQLRSGYRQDFSVGKAVSCVHLKTTYSILPRTFMSHLLSTSPPPLRLLLLLLRMMPNDATHQEVQQLVSTSEDEDWDVFFDLAIEHRVLPLLHQRIQDRYADIFPEDIQADFEDEVFENGARNVTLSRALLTAIARLREHGIPALAFKGPTLATMVYGDLSQRMFSDLDILVPEAHFLEARKVLVDAGYDSDIRSLFLITSDQQEQALLCALGECPLHKAKRSVQIDLHQRLVAGDFVQLANPLDAQIWQHPHTTQILDTDIPTLGIEDLVLYLCVHGTKDLWRRLGWLCDLALLANASAQPSSSIHIQWDVVLQKAQQHHLESMVGMSLALAENLLGLPLPADIKVLQMRPNHDALVQKMLNRCAASLPEPERSSHLVERFHARLQCLDHPKDRWLCAIAFYKSLVTPTYADTRFIQLPPSFHSLYRVIRPYRLLNEWLRPTSPKMSLDAEI